MTYVKVIVIIHNPLLLFCVQSTGKFCQFNLVFLLLPAFNWYVSLNEKLDFSRLKRKIILFWHIVSILAVFCVSTSLQEAGHPAVVSCRNYPPLPEKVIIHGCNSECCTFESGEYIFGEVEFTASEYESHFIY